MRRRGRAKYSENGATKNVFIKGGEKFPYIFFMYYIVSHTIFVSLSYTQGRFIQHKKLQCINALCRFLCTRCALRHPYTLVNRSFPTQPRITLAARQEKILFFIHIWIYFQFLSVSRQKRFFSVFQSS